MGNAANATISDAAPALWIAMGIFAVVFFVLAAVRIPEPLRDPGRQEREKGQAQRHLCDKGMNQQSSVKSCVLATNTGLPVREAPRARSKPPGKRVGGA